jgi:hypothetical protein
MKKIMQVELVIGIVLYNNPISELIRLLNSVHAAALYSGLSYKIIGWNNGRQIKLDQDKNFNVINHTSKHKNINLGFGKAHNNMMKFAFSKEVQANYYLCLNPDGLLHLHALDHLVNLAKDYGDKALIEAAQVPIEHPKIYDPIRFDTPWISGACFLLSKEIYQIVGGFDDQLFMYCEDVDFSWRVKKSGFLLKFCPNAWFYHDTSDRKSDLIKDQMLFLSARYLATKWSMPEFKLWIESRMIEMGIFPSSLYMPHLDLKEVYPLDPTIVEGGQHLYFALPRWWV